MALRAAYIARTTSLRAAVGRAQSLHQLVSSCKDLIRTIACFSALLNLLYIAPSIYMLQVYDRVVPTRGGTTLFALSVILILAVTTIAALDFARARLLARCSARLERLFTPAILDGLFARRSGAARHSSSMLREFDTLRQVLTGVGIIAICDIPWAPIYILICFLFHPALGLYSIGCCAILLATTWFAEKNAKLAVAATAIPSREFYQDLETTIGGAETIVALGMQPAIAGGHLSRREDLAIDQLGASITASKFVTITKTARMLMQSLGLGLGAYLAIEQKISAGAIFAASLLLSRALSPIEGVTSAWRSLAHARVAYASLEKFLAAVAPQRGYTRLPDPQGLIEVDQLSVATEDRSRALLQNLTFRVEPGEMLGIVGPSGAGKTTLLRALAGVIPIHAGSIRIDGARIDDWDPTQLAASIGYVSQASPLFPGTIKDNITRFRTRVGAAGDELDAKAVEVAQLCGAHEMILRLPAGYDTYVDALGMQLSAGQRQLIALCRALFGDPVILLLDEPNASLDSNGESALTSVLTALQSRGATVIIAAHQLRLIEGCTKLAVLREGRLAYFGSKEDTVARIESAKVAQS